MVIGAGYVGLSMAAVLSKVHQVMLVELKQEVVESVNQGISPIGEEGLEDLVSRGVQSHRLEAMMPDTKFSQQDVIIICVDTPCAEDGSASLVQVNSVIDMIESRLDELCGEYLVLALRSTVPPTTTRRMVLERLQSSRRNVGVVFSPEFLRQGYAVHDLTKPDRVVIGGSDQRAIEQYREMLVSCLEQAEPRTFTMTLESAELCKYVSNSFLASKISFANEIAALAEKIPDVSVDDVMDGVMADRRICPSHLKPGLGFGGSCFPKDLSALIDFADGRGVDMKILRSVLKVNIESTKRLLELLRGVVPSMENKKIAVLGLTFKAGTDDTRSSPSLELIERICSFGAIVSAHDPAVNMKTMDSSLKEKFEFCDNIDACLKDSDAVVLMTDWPVYVDLGLKKLTDQTKTKIFVDGRRVFANSKIPQGVTYKTLGSF